MARSFYLLMPALRFLGLLLLLPLVLTARENPPPPAALATTLASADKLLKEKNWTEARAAYDEALRLKGDWNSPQARLAVEGAISCSIELKLWDDALDRARVFIAQNRGRFEEAVGERFLAGLYLAVPHNGTKQGGVYYRGEYKQGVHVSSFAKDRREAILHYEKARSLIEGFQKSSGDKNLPDSPEFRSLLVSEKIGVNFDLTAALSRRSPYGPGIWGWCGWWWGSWEPEEESEALEEADYEEPRGFGRYNNNETPPQGLPLGPDGRPSFPSTPTTYSPKLGDGPKIRFLLAEIQNTDPTETKDHAARALHQRAMICRSLYGPEIRRQWDSLNIRYNHFGQPLPPIPSGESALKNNWELDDNEAITLAGGKLRVITLPDEENPLALLRNIGTLYPKSKQIPEALYTRGLYYQSRQQFPKAIQAYEPLVNAQPAGSRTNDAKEQIAAIRQPSILLDRSGVYLPDTAPKLAFSSRNATTVRFTARPFDLAAYSLKGLSSDDANRWTYYNFDYHLFQEDRWKPYTGDIVKEWKETIPDKPTLTTTTASTSAPLPRPGAYIVEATVDGNPQPSRVLVLVTDIAIVHKNLSNRGLIYLADARTGQPLANQPVKVFENWSEYIQTKQKAELKHLVSDLRTDEAGVIEYKRKEIRHGGNISTVVNLPGNRTAVSFFQNWSESDPGEYHDSGPRIYVITDRPVYRPGSTVQFRAWIRTRTQGRYEPVSAGMDSSLQIFDTKNNPVFSTNLKTDGSGSISGEYKIPAEDPPLGIYSIHVRGYGPNQVHNAGGLFRVEEYKKPEFEVRVKPAKTQARLGDKVKARIEANYYFRAPVAKGEVSYKIFRENYQHVYWGPAEYDWLYGKGYGRSLYPCSWFPWWNRWGCFVLGDLWPWPTYGGQPHAYPNRFGGDFGEMGRRSFESGTRKALRELVAQGKTSLKADGSCEVEIDTAPAKRDLADRDHRYTIEAEVRDESRRTITGQGDIKVTRQEFYAFVETNNGWYRPGNEAFLQVRNLTPDNVPVASDGKVTVTRIRHDGPGQTKTTEEEVRSWNASTDAEGRLSFKVPLPGEGQYRISYRTRDSWKEEVQGNAVFWVCGPQFDGRIHRFNDLEIIADKRDYKPGETAHLLINTAENNSRILFSDQLSQGVLRSYRFIDLPQRSTILDLPITESQIPNFFVEATLVRNGRVHMEQRELFVPPSHKLLKLGLKTDKPTYKPGEKGKIEITLEDAGGKPVAGQVTLTAFDEAVTYIQDEFGPSPKNFYHGQRRFHQPYVDASLDRSFHAFGSLRAPEHETYRGGAPEGWQGMFWTGSGSITLSGSEAADTDRLDGYNLRLLAAQELPGSNAVMGAAGGMAMPAVAASPMRKNTAMAVFAGEDKSMLMRDEARKEDNFAAKDQKSLSGYLGSLFNPPLVDPAIRNNFADTALWLPDLQTGPDGKASAEITFPDSLTTWRLRGYGLTHDTRVGDAKATAITSKGLIVRLQSPRFFIERDEVVLSANVHNYLGKSKKVSAELILPAALFESLGDTSAEKDKDGNLHLKATATVKAKGEARFDWPVKVRTAGLARITVKALTDEESDAMQMAFPVLVHGINKTVAQGGSFRVGDSGTRSLELNLPAEIDPEQTRLETTLSPGLGGVMIDALPYLVGYPYGCVEQTMSRFYPTVLVKDTLKKMGTDLEKIGEQRKQMNPDDVKNRFQRGDQDPVYNSKELDRMVRAGLQRIASFQRADGGWGWWKEDDSSPFQTAYVILGLHAAKEAGVHVDDNTYQRGLGYLQNAIRRELKKDKKDQSLGGLETQAYLAYVLALTGRINNDDQVQWLDELYEERGNLNNYGKSLLALAFKLRKQDDRAGMLLRNVLQFAERDDSNETAWIRTPQQGWWFWWNNDIETNAWVLKALASIDPQNDLAPRLVKWLLNNRKNGHYWRSTRDTALVIAAMSDYMRASGESNPDYTLVVKIDGRPVREVKVTKENFFTFDNRILLYGLQIKPGGHTVTIEKQGPGALYYSAYLGYFTKEEDVQGAGNEIFIKRDYYRLKPKTETVTAQPKSNWFDRMLPAGREKPESAEGRTELRDGNERILLKSGDAVTSGETIEVVLKITSKNTYDYLAFEDMKPAGCEPMELRSGGRFAGGLCPNVELRDEKTVFFIGLLEQGEHILRYKLRAETPGTFHALPTSGFAMYAPEVKAISDEMRLKIKDR